MDGKKDNSGITSSRSLGRPTDYNEEIALEITSVISVTSKGLKQLCDENPHWPCRTTIYAWRIANSDFANKYAQAKRHQIEVFVDEVLQIADDSADDFDVNEDGKVISNHEHIHRSRLKIDTRKWLAAKLCPRLYGESAAITQLNERLDEMEQKNASKEISK